MLTDRKISDKEYEHVWEKIEMKMMKDDLELYLKCDVLLLADVLENFRNKNLKNKCPSHYLRGPGLSWDAMLKMKKIGLEFIPDTNMHIFFEKGTRGWNSNISNRYSKHNKKYLKPCHAKEELEHILYLDANNSYDHVISKFLPSGRFKWIDPKEFDLNKCTNNTSNRCVIEVGLVYPKELQE